MQYRKDKKGNDLSLLGYGCMRFPKKGGSVDIAETEKQIMDAYSLGINYYDTAYIYGSSESVLGEIVERNGIRENIKITTKLPQYLVRSRNAVDRYLDEQLSRLRTDYIDYYLMHMLTDFAMWEKLKNIGILEWIEDNKKSGKIRNVGFSYHGNTDGFLKILNDYDWDICQIQYNYLDEHSQAGKTGLKAAGEKGIPVVIMEPLRGGKLVSMLPEGAKQVMKESNRDWTPAEWSFRWLYDQPEVTVVLSGMNSMDMIRENCRTASDAMPGSFTDTDFENIRKITEKIRENEKVGCTGCRYCMPCPQGVDIPGAFAAYNSMYLESKSQGRHQYFQTVGLRKDPAFPSQCIACGKCEKHCPQGIKIIDMLKEADKALRPLPYKVALGVARKFVFMKTRKKKEEK